MLKPIGVLVPHIHTNKDPGIGTNITQEEISALMPTKINAIENLTKKQTCKLRS
jgi:hypothetical protein